MHRISPLFTEPRFRAGLLLLPRQLGWFDADVSDRAGDMGGAREIDGDIEQQSDDEKGDEEFNHCIVSVRIVSLRSMRRWG